jgi:hypothetical protein
VAGIRELIESAQAQLLYLPPCSPDLNPSSKPGPSSSSFCRAAKAHAAETLDRAITKALKTITPENAAAWLRHCGYGIQ